MNRDQSQTSLSLIIRMSNKEELAWEQFVTLYSALVTRWIRKFGVSDNDVHDLSQQLFSRVNEKLDMFEAQRKGRTFRGWMYRITQHLCMDHFRKNNLAPKAIGGSDALQAMQQVPKIADETPESLKHELVDLHRRALNILKTDFEDRTWQIFNRYAIDGLKAREVADEFETTVEAVRKTKSRVLSRLRDEFSGLLY